MPSFRLLYLDNNPDHLAKYKRWLSRAWDSLNPASDLEIQTVSDPETAIKELHNSQWNLFVADILFGKKNDEPLGLDCISEARADNEALPIIALSIGNGGYEEISRKAGADEYISKAYLAEGRDPVDTRSYIAEKLLSALRKHGGEPALTDLSALHLDKDDLDLLCVVDVIGRENVVNLTTRSLGRDCRRIQPKFVRPGLSGAAVLRVDCDLRVQREHVPETRSLLLKISSNRQPLVDELKKDLHCFPDELFVKYACSEPVPSGSWHAISANFKEAQTLQDWFSGQPQTPRVNEMLDDLFFKVGLAGVYQNAVDRPDERPINDIHDVLLTQSRKSRIRAAIRDCTNLTRRHDPDGTFDPHILETFVTSRRLGQIDEEVVPRSSTWCKSHGDLHGRNILVTNRGPRLIDPASVDEFPWPADLARLMVDLLVSGWDRGDESHEWSRMEQWLRAAQAFIRDDTAWLLAVRLPNRPVGAALAWFRQNAAKLYGDFGTPKRPEWQFLLAMAIEFLRCTYRYQELGMPKRVMSLLCACDAMRAAEAKFPQ